MTPWYLRWYTLTGAGVVVAGAIGGIVYAATREEPLAPTALEPGIQLP